MSTEQEREELEQMLPPGLLNLLRTCPLPQDRPAVIVMPPPADEQKPGE